MITVNVRSTGDSRFSVSLPSIEVSHRLILTLLASMEGWSVEILFALILIFIYI